MRAESEPFCYSPGSALRWVLIGALHQARARSNRATFTFHNVYFVVDETSDLPLLWAAYWEAIGLGVQVGPRVSSPPTVAERLARLTAHWSIEECHAARHIIEQLRRA